MSIALNQIIIRAQHEMKLAQARLEVEEKGREVAKLQGHVAGYKEIIGIIAGRFHLHQSMIEETGDEPFIVPELSDEDLETLRLDVADLTEREEWIQVLQRVEANIDGMKSLLLFKADSARDLDICQGKHQGQIIYESFFNSVEQEVERRAKEAEKKRKQPSLFEDGTSNVVQFPARA